MLTNNGETNALKAISRTVQSIMCSSSANKLHLPVSLKLFKLSELNPIADVINTYRELVKTRNDKFDTSEKQLNTFGYMLLMKKHYKEADSIFGLNLEIHPEVVNP